MMCSILSLTIGSIDDDLEALESPTVANVRDSSEVDAIPRDTGICVTEVGHIYTLEV